MRTIGYAGLALAALLPLASCGLPKDSEGTTERILGSRVLRVGVSENSPWVDGSGPEPGGIEPELIRNFAKSLGARVEWVRNGETPLLEALEERKLDLVAGGIKSDTPWKGSLGVSQVYLKQGSDRHVLLTAPGENQLLLRLDRFIVDAKPALQEKYAPERSK